MVTTILCLLVAFAVVFITALAQRVRASPTRVVPNVEAAVVGGAVINFFDTLGIGSFAPTTAYFKFRRLVPDRLIPATLIAASALPAITQALIYVRVIKVDPALLVICIAAAVFGSWLGSRFALGLPTRPIRLAMGSGLLIAASLMALSNLGLLPVGGTALELDPLRMGIAAGACFVFGGLLNLGIGFYAPTLIVLSLLGLEPRAVFPIMMGACAFLMPVTGLKIVRHPEIDLRIVLGIAIGAIPAILLAAFFVKEIPLQTLRWLVIAIVLYAGGLMLLAGLREEPGQEWPMRALSREARAGVDSTADTSSARGDGSMSFRNVVGNGERAKANVLIAQTTQCWAAPDVTDFGIGQPQDEILPVDILHKAALQQATGGRRHSLQYGTELGDGHLRLALASFLSEHYAISVDPEPIFITNGNSQAIDIVCTAFTRPGEVVFVEEPSYFLALDIFRNHHLKIVGIPVDEDGLSIDALEAALEQHAPTLIYTIPAFHNPTGVTLSAERRQRLVELAVQHGFLIVADEVYQLLDYLSDAPAPMAAYLDSGRVLSLGTFSKILAPGLRLGWIQAEMSLLQRLAKTAYVVSGGGLNPYTSSVVQCVIEQGWQAEYLQTLRALFRGRADVMHNALMRHFPKDISYKKPTGGYFFWLKFATETDTAQFLNKARDLKVGFRPGSAFSVSGGQKNFMRLSFAFYDADRIEAGIGLLARAISSSKKMVSGTISEGRAEG